jgi:PPP family 3-phenylpropionic acid transporter
MAEVRGNEVFLLNKGKSGFPWRLAPFFMMQFACNAIYQNNISNYLRTEGQSDAAIGGLLALVPIAGMLGQMIFGRVGDHMKHKNTLLVLLAVLSAVCFFLFGQAGATGILWLIGLLLCLYAFFQMSSEPLMSAIALESLDNTKTPYGPIRSIGTLSFAVFSPVVGMLIDDDYTRMVYFLVAALLLCAGSALLMPKVEGHARSSTRHVSVKHIVKDKTLMILTGFCFCMMISFSTFYTFYPIHFTSEAVGGSSGMLGWGFFISAMSEMPFLLCSDRIFKKLGVSRMLAIVCGVLVVRLALLGLITDPYWMLATQALHSWGFVVITFSMSKFINLVMPMELKATGQMFFTLVALTLARSIGSLLGSALSGILNLSGVFLAASGFAALLLIAFIVMLIKNPALRQAAREE